MDFLNTVSLWIVEWLDHTAQLVERMCVVVVAAFLSIRVESFRVAMAETIPGGKRWLISVAAFSLLAVVGTHSGIIVELHTQGDETGDLLHFLGRHLHVHADGRTKGWLSNAGVHAFEAAINFRDLMVMVAGLVGGPWTGLAVGSLAGAERYLLGGFAAPAQSLASPMTGVGAGLVRHLKPAWAVNPVAVVAVGLGGTVAEKFLVLLLTEPFSEAVLLSRATFLSMAVVNALGCFLFLTVVQDLDRHRLENAARDAQLRTLEIQLERDRLAELASAAELRALRAQIEPHFLNNTLTAIQELIVTTPERANAYVIKLARFFGRTREYANASSIRLQDELEQLHRYLDFQSLRYAETLSCKVQVPDGLLVYRIPPRSLQTLVENALTHGYEGNARPFTLHVFGEDHGDSLVLRVADNGRGIPAARLPKLGSEPVPSERGSGSALYQLTRSLELIFGSRASLKLFSAPGEGAEAILVLPKIEEPW